LVDAILTPTREPSLLSFQIQQGPGHLRAGLFLGYAGLDEAEIRAGIERFAEVLAGTLRP
jgi:DNA-binding transcriptional MocR family regulator